ncbi:MAG: benzoyl-CoA reductase subunit D [Bacteroidetes bacterium]|jgi:benzoyl-CoA reductase subunit D|nr:benzoyl-CoA reductase subunit D [Bacteroidota bacterium]
MDERIFTIGIDVGSSYIKTVLIDYSDKIRVLDKHIDKIRKRNPALVAEDSIDYLLEKNKLRYDDIAYIASTGEGEMVTKKTGHFYSMTTHARGATFLFPQANYVVDMGALYVKAIKIDNIGRVLDYKMTGQCASGSGQFIENISRYLGLAISEVGEISLKSKDPETPSGICAVLAETDVINMVSRGVSTPDIVKGIHISVANRVIKLLTTLKANGTIVLTGGMAANIGMVETVKELAQKANIDPQKIVAHADSIYAGALGAAIWGGFRYNKLKVKGVALA